MTRAAGPPRLRRRPDRRQVVLEAVCWEERLAADQAARAARAVVERLDLSPIRERIAAARAVLPELPAVKEHHPGKPSKDQTARVSTTDPQSRRMKLGDGAIRPG